MTYFTEGEESEDVEIKRGVNKGVRGVDEEGSSSQQQDHFF